MRTSFGSQARGQRRYGLLVLAFVITSFAIGYLVIIVRAELSELATASSDNVQWNLSQAEVEHFAFLTEVQKASVSPDPDLSQVKRRFDIFYSRITILSQGSLYTDIFIEGSDPAASLAELQLFLKEVAVLIDGDEATLTAQLPQIAERSELVRNDVRAIALEGIKHFAELRDQHRNSVYRTLAHIALLTSGLLILLLVFVYFLNRTNKISHRRMIQNELTNARMSAIVSTSLDAIIATDREGKVVEFNGAAEDIFGYSRSEAVGSSMAELIIPDHLREAHSTGMKHYMKTGEKRVVGKGRIRLEAKRKNLEIFPVEFSVNEMPGGDERLFISYLRDISKEAAAEGELRRARDSAVSGEKSKSRLLAVMSHEMRTPLNGLLGTMELLSDTSLNERQKHYLRIMEKSGNLLLSHVNDVLDISRLEAGKMDVETKIFDLNMLIEELIEGQQAIARDKSNSLTYTSFEHDQLLVNGDQLRLRQVLLNLIGNAIKFTRNGEISVEFERLERDNLIEIRVADTGVGINAEDLGHIFEDFMTLDSSYGRQSEGTGLGLGIARRIVHAMGGEIGVESEPGEGSLFWVRLPIGLDPHVDAQDEKQATNVTSATHWPKMDPLEILLVEDNEINRMVARDFLESDGHHVSEAHDGNEGVAWAERKKFDLILMDISMPELDGIAATKAIRGGEGMSKNTPIFALTAHALKEDVKRFHAAGMKHVISKPVSRASMQRAISSLQRGPMFENATSNDDAQLVDQEVLGQFRVDLGPERFALMYNKFIEETDQTLKELADLDHEMDGEDIAKSAHRLAGSAAMFGAQKMRQALNAIELAAKSEPSSRHVDHVQTAIDIWGKTHAQLEQGL